MKKLFFSILFSLLLSVVALTELSAQTATNAWQQYRYFGSGTRVNATISWQGHDYAATSKGVYYRRKGLKTWQLITKTNPSTSVATGNFVQMFIDESDGNRLRLLSNWTHRAGTTLWYIVRSVPNTLYRDKTTNSKGYKMYGTPNGENGMTFGLKNGLYAFAGGARADLINIRVQSKLLNNPRDANNPYAYKQRSKRYAYSAYGYVYSKNINKPSVLLGGDGFVMRSTIDNNVFYWDYIDKGLASDCGKITVLETGYGTQREYRNSKNQRSHFIASENGHIYRGIGNGNIWVRFNHNLPANVRVYDLATHGEWLYAATSRGVYVTKVESTDKGFAALKADWKEFGKLPDRIIPSKVLVVANMLWILERNYVYIRIGQPPYY